MNLSVRLDASEILDSGEYSEFEYEQTMQQLATINRLTNCYGPSLEAFKKTISLTPDRPIRVLDVGFGYGDTLRVLAKYARDHEIAAEFVGIDLNSLATEVAKKADSSLKNITYLTGDVFRFEVQDKFHLIMSAQMTHHLPDEEVVRLLKWMHENARTAWFINDLHRHPVAYHFIGPATRLLGFNRLITNDAPVSVARSFTRSAWESLINQAGLSNANVSIKWHWAFRYGVFCAK